MQVECITARVTRKGNGEQFGRLLFCQIQPLHSLEPLFVASTFSFRLLGR
jgi:hypothetical protein